MANSIKSDELVIYSLKKLYEKYGYTQYKMNKFEEYDYYVRNKDFLVSDQIITFNDTDGKLMALKPDVTLSIIKNGSDEKGDIQKVYYNENVYRVPKGSGSYKEIMQVGLECIGDTDSYTIYETLLLALKSLEIISPDYVLDISDMGIVSELIGSKSSSEKKLILKCIGEKNPHDIPSAENSQKLQKLARTYGSSEEVAEALSEIYEGKLSAHAKRLIHTAAALENEGFGGKIRIDFSVLNDMRYYNGIVFKGFVNGIPTSILSGGQYDGLMEKVGRKSGAVGFAVYSDLLKQYAESHSQYDVDTVVIYGEDTDISKIRSAIKGLSDAGSVLTRKTPPKNLKYRRLITLDKNGEVIFNA